MTETVDREIAQRDAARKKARRRRIARTAALSTAFAGAMAAALFALAERAAEGAADARANALSERIAPPQEPEVETVRAEIVDRNGVTLATRIRTYELYLDAAFLETAEERAETASALVGLFPDLDVDKLLGDMTSGGTRLLRRPLTAIEAQAAHDLGVPGLYLRPRSDRLYPAGRIAAHVVGWTDVDGVGRAGVEAAAEARLASGGAPLALTLDLRVQTALRAALSDEIERTGAKAAAAIVMEARTGAVRALVSLPDYDPHRRPAPPQDRRAAEASPLFHRAVAGRFELGSVMKTVTWALALEAGVAEPNDVFDATEPLVVLDHTVTDDHPVGVVSFPMAFAKSSNIVAARLALAAGPEAQNRFFAALGLHEPSGIEQGEAAGLEPRWTAPWNAVATATSAFGYGVSLTPAHLAATVASLVNGGLRVRPTLLADAAARAEQAPIARVVSAETSKHMRDLLRLVVTSGTGRRADSPGLEIGGKTGTAEKQTAGGYVEDRVVATFAAAFPMSKPRYVVVTMLDEPELLIDGEAQRGAGLIAAPTARAVIERIAPLLGVGLVTADTAAATR